MMATYKKSEYCKMTLIFFIIFFSRYIYILNLLSNLPVATTTVERSFSVMKIENNRICSRMSDQWMDENLIVYIRKDISRSINNKFIMQQFQNMKHTLKSIVKGYNELIVCYFLVI
jgi:hypothetical protein